MCGKLSIQAKSVNTLLPAKRLMILGTALSGLLAGCAYGPRSASDGQGATAGTGTAVDAEHEVLYRPRLIRGDYFLEKGVDPNPTIKIGTADKAVVEEQKDLRQEVTELNDRLKKVEVGSSPVAAPAVQSTAPSGGRGQGVSPAGPATSSYDALKRRLETLKRLRDDGLLSQQEYQARREALLDSL